MQYKSPARYICDTIAPNLLHHPLAAGPPFGSPKVTEGAARSDAKSDSQRRKRYPYCCPSLALPCLGLPYRCPSL
eukprot:8019723-Pyramimonas_sp.AAC.1